MVTFVDFPHFPTATVAPQKNAAICQSYREYRLVPCALEVTAKVQTPLSRLRLP